MNRKNIITLTILCLLLAVSAEAQSLVPLKGTRLSVTPPEGFALAKVFSGYMSKKTDAMIIVWELPFSYAEMIKAFDREELQEVGKTLLSRQEATFGEFEGFLFLVSEEARGKSLRRWIGIFGDSKTTNMVIATFRMDRKAEAALSEALKKSVLSTRLVSGP
jgi:hypothetical protein